MEAAQPATVPETPPLLLRLIDSFVPEALDARPHERLRARILVAMALGFLGVVVASALLLQALLAHPEVSLVPAYTVLAGLAVGLVHCPLLLRATGSVAAAGHALLAVIYLSLLAGSTLQGGDRAPSFSIYIVVPVTALLLRGRRAGVLWGCGVVASWLAFHALGRAGVAFPGVLPAEPYQASQLLNLVISCVAIVSVVVVYETMNETLRRRLAEDRARFEFLARHDPLTGAPNRRFFFELLESAIRRARRTKLSLALYIVDLNDFKAVNDTFGHRAGDQALKEMAERLRGVLRLSDCVARLGGDEFAVVVELVRQREDAMLVGRKIQRELARPLQLRGEAVQLSAAVGIALYPEDASDAESLQEAADAAMYGSKYARVDRTLAEAEAEGG